MSETPQNTSQPGTPPPTTEGKQAEAPRVDPPMLPTSGAILAAPLTGQGPHRSEEAKNKKIEEARARHGVPKPPPAPPSAPPAHPPRVRRPPAKPPTSAAPQSQPEAPQVPHPVVAGTGMAALQDAATASLVSQVLNANRQVGQKFLLLVLPEDDWPRCEEFDVVTHLVDRIKELLGECCHLFPFLGMSLAITEGPNRFLQTPFGALPLFDLPDPSTVDATQFGWVGPEIDRPQAPGAQLDEDDDEPPTSTPGSEQAPQPEAPPEEAIAEGDTPMFGSV